jgi:hypothetical protein
MYPSVSRYRLCVSSEFLLPKAVIVVDQGERARLEDALREWLFFKASLKKIQKTEWSVAQPFFS